MCKNMQETIVFAGNDVDENALNWLKELKNVTVKRNKPENSDAAFLEFKDGAITLCGNGSALKPDFTRLLPRITPNRLNGEMLIKAAKIKGVQGTLTAVDATAGLGEDAFLLAAAGYNVRLYERDNVIALLLFDALRRACMDERLSWVAERMTLFQDDSMEAMPKLCPKPDIILLDPMFPARQKSGLIKKKFQLLQRLESPCEDEEKLLSAAITSNPRKIIIKRPLKGPYLAGKKPDYSIMGKSIRYDCIALRQN